jgi:hypothetical protein
VGNNPVNFVDPWGLKDINPVALKVAKGGIFGLIGLGIEYTSQKIEPGKVRGTLKIIHGITSIYSGGQIGGASIIVALAATADPEPLTKIFGYGMTAIMLPLSGELIGGGFAQVELGWEEVSYQHSSEKNICE